jgi:hypothetical protein
MRRGGVADQPQHGHDLAPGGFVDEALLQPGDRLVEGDPHQRILDDGHRELSALVAEARRELVHRGRPLAQQVDGEPVELHGLQRDRCGLAELRV